MKQVLKESIQYSITSDSLSGIIKLSIFQTAYINSITIGKDRDIINTINDGDYLWDQERHAVRKWPVDNF